MVCIIHPSLSLVLSTVIALVDGLGLTVYLSAYIHASSMSRDPALSLTVGPRASTNAVVVDARCGNDICCFARHFGD